MKLSGDRPENIPNGENLISTFGTRTIGIPDFSNSVTSSISIVRKSAIRALPMTTLFPKDPVIASDSTIFSPSAVICRVSKYAKTAIVNINTNTTATTILYQRIHSPPYLHEFILASEKSKIEITLFCFFRRIQRIIEPEHQLQAPTRRYPCCTNRVNSNTGIGRSPGHSAQS